MPADVTSAANTSELTPFVWIAGFAFCFALHLLIHPQARVFRDALRWLGRHPAPLLWLMASLMLSSAWMLHTGASASAPSTIPAATPWPDAFITCLPDAWRRLALVFHQAILPPPLMPGTWLGAALQAMISATGQMWLACYFIASSVSVSDDTAALRRTAARWPVIVGLAICHLPWWWAQGSGSAFLRNALLPEFFLLLAPLPLAAAAEELGFLKAGTLALNWWRRSWGQLLMFAITAFPLLLLLEYCLRLLPGIVPASQLLVRIFLESILASAIQMWLFVTAALLLLRGAYVVADPADD